MLAWRTGTDTAETHWIEKGTGPHRAEIQAQSCRVSKGKEREARQPVRRDNCMYAKETGFALRRKTKAEQEAAIKKKLPVSAAVGAVAEGFKAAKNTMQKILELMKTC